MKRLKIAVTGAGGFLNARLLHHYASKYEMIPLTRKELNLTSAEETNRIIKEIRPDIIIHGAAMTATLECEKYPELAYQVNVEASWNLARAAQAMQAKMIFFSSEQVFNGNVEDGPYTEETKACPNTVYGKSKLEAEALLIKAIEHLWILRFSWLFGLPERNMPIGVNLFWNVIKAGLKGCSIKVPVKEYRGITYVYNIIDHFDQIFDIPYGTYHFGSSNNLSTYETAVYILEQLGAGKDQIDKVIIPDHEQYQDKARDVRLAYEKIKGTGIPITTSQESIDRAINEYRFKL